MRTHVGNQSVENARQSVRGFAFVLPFALTSRLASRVRLAGAGAGGCVRGGVLLECLGAEAREKSGEVRGLQRALDVRELPNARQRIELPDSSDRRIGGSCLRCWRWRWRCSGLTLRRGSTTRLSIAPFAKKNDDAVLVVCEDHVAAIIELHNQVMRVITRT